MPLTQHFLCLPFAFAIMAKRIRRKLLIGVFIVDDAAGVRRLDSNEVVTTVVPPTAGTFTEDAVRSRDGSYYVADYQFGLKRVRPGTGQSPEFFVAKVRPGTILFEMQGVTEEIAREAMRLAAHKLSVKTKFLVKEDA